MPVKLALAAALAALAAAQTAAQDLNDYPTVARADYVFGCMAANGNTRQALEHCACSIDHIASVLPYDRYVSAETVLRMRQLGGERTGVFRNAAEAKESVSNLRRAQAEADIICF
ncbi:MAG: hypothetical protein ACFCUS_01465 [Rubrimonas sp.]|uniref:hypothetical protein n=1 Tax=Rubrimonas sp. TaxID=2036015 RepID=UPI002FDD5DC0